MKYESISKRKNGLIRYKFVCPKMKYVYDKSTQKTHRKCMCESPCTTSSCGRMIHIYPEKDLRAYPGVLRGTEEWENTYKIRTAVERDINHLKEHLCLAGQKTQNEKTLHADLILAGITQLITVVLADKIHHHEYIRSLKPLASHCFWCHIHRKRVSQSKIYHSKQKQILEIIPKASVTPFLEFRTATTMRSTRR